MAITDNKTFGWNINWKQALGLAGIGLVVVATIWSDSLVLGYTVMTLVLCAFFMIVAFDIGVTKSEQPSEADAAPADAGATRRRPTREV